MTIDQIYHQLVLELETAGAKSPYTADANEPDPRYKAYGVRSPEKKSIFKKFRPSIRKLDQPDQIDLAKTSDHIWFWRAANFGAVYLTTAGPHLYPRQVQPDRHADTLLTRLEQS